MGGFIAYQCFIPKQPQEYPPGLSDVETAALKADGIQVKELEDVIRAPERERREESDMGGPLPALDGLGVYALAHGSRRPHGRSSDGGADGFVLRARLAKIPEDTSTFRHMSIPINNAEVDYGPVVTVVGSAGLSKLPVTLLA